MQIKTTMRYHLTLVRMAIIKKSPKYTSSSCWRGCGKKGTLLHYWWECKLIQSLWRFLKKLKTELPYDPAIPLLGIYPEKTIIQKDTCTPMFTAALFTLARTRKQNNQDDADQTTTWPISRWPSELTGLFLRVAPPSAYESSCPLIGGGGWGSWPLYRSPPSLSHPRLPASEIKQTFLSTNPASLFAFEW